MDYQKDVVRNMVKSAPARNTSRVPSESREAMYRRAMHLITARCTSTAPGMETPYGTVRNNSAFGVQVPQYFYIKQERPTPMPPLKAWQGYNGNVYFEPIHISSIRDFPEKPNNPYESRSNSELHRMLLSSQQQERPDSDAMRTLSRNTGKTSSSLKSSRPNTKQVVMLDKKMVLNSYNDSLNDDLDIIEGTENTGSLSVRPKSDRTFDRKPQPVKVYNKEKICKGSVVHKLNVSSRQNSARPAFKVSGGKYSCPTNTSPLLRTQTQYSLSNQRLTTNSPDMYSQQLLPPLEQLRTAVRHMDTISKDRVGFGRIRPVTYTEDFKPFIKYNQDAKRQTNFV